MVNRLGDKDTICAVSTAPGTGGIAVIRLSGKQALEIGLRLCSFLPIDPESHRVYYGILKTLGDSSPVDEVLVTYFAAGRSFTSEQTLEISCHGGQILTSIILRELINAGARPADRGEFTYRAFMNGRLDLVQAESVLTLIESRSKQSAKVSLRQLQGALSAEFRRIEDDLVWLLAQLEASIDFSAEGIEIIPSQVLLGRLTRLIDFVNRMVASFDRGRLLRDGLQVALVGAPNAGKSSLLNSLLREERAIVTPIAGTTRDLVEGRMSFGGVPVTLVDTAGLRETNDEIERIGIDRSRGAMRASDLIFYVVDLGSPAWRNDLVRFIDERGAASTEAYFVFNKIDLSEADGGLQESRQFLRDQGLETRGLWVSATKSKGLETIEALLEDHVKVTEMDETGVVMQARHVEGLRKISSGLERAVGLVRSDASPEFIAFELQEGVRSIHSLLGLEFDEQVIDRIFKEFCLGK